MPFLSIIPVSQSSFHLTVHSCLLSSPFAASVTLISVDSRHKVYRRAIRGTHNLLDGDN
ncbi:hypothetical protein E2C01_096561 [Portunus trituberculatus]|uniref:Uncharacterized protein n=1 Tax=Portunus trituberculatus TaxID=210409 RepID=A0A5B7K224_PORTR|nr:hypothetical protein [Portunus trituberculatus]